MVKRYSLKSPPPPNKALGPVRSVKSIWFCRTLIPCKFATEAGVCRFIRWLRSWPRWERWPKCELLRSLYLICTVAAGASVPPAASGCVLTNVKHGRLDPTENLEGGVPISEHTPWRPATGGDCTRRAYTLACVTTRERCMCARGENGAMAMLGRALFDVRRRPSRRTDAAAG